MPELLIDQKPFTQNRELSWLRFNERVLEEADDPAVPLLERLKFVAIFISNLDEFFMIRVGSLFDLAAIDENNRDNKSGMTPMEQLEKIYAAIGPLYQKKTAVYERVKAELRAHGVHPLNLDELAGSEVKFVKDYYKTNIKPILSPQIVDNHHPFPHIPSKDIYVIVLLKEKNNIILGLLPVPSTLPEVVILPGTELRYVRTEKIIYEYASDAFGHREILEKNCVCITRNADIRSDDEVFEVDSDFRSRMKKLLHKRRLLSVVRLEANFPLSAHFSTLLCGRFEIQPRQIFISDTALNMNYAFSLADKLSPAQKKQLSYPEFIPQQSANLDVSQSVMRQIRHKDVLLCYPYESMDPFLQLIKEAANDKNVISIKITIYRLAKRAKLVDYLCTAAENGKDVTVIMELRARFDEQNNIDWSEKLEDAGCKITYGFDEYKVHSKICLITRKEKNGVSYITQVGTGNYNEKTATLYTDLCLITANNDIGADATEFFKNLSIGNIEGEYKTLLVAPSSLKSTLLHLISREMAKGTDGFILIKINSLTDLDFIEKLSEASCAGVRVQLIVRGICCLLPQVPGKTDNITAISIVGRFLEHSRVYCFGHGDGQTMFLSSADLMTRNTEQRIEVACPILDKDLRRQVNKLLEAMWFDNVKAKILCADGSYIRKVDNRPPLDSQTVCANLLASENQKSKTKVKKKFLHRVAQFLQGPNT